MKVDKDKRENGDLEWVRHFTQHFESRSALVAFIVLMLAFMSIFPNELSFLICCVLLCIAAMLSIAICIEPKEKQAPPVIREIKTIQQVPRLSKPKNKTSTRSKSTQKRDIPVTPTDVGHSANQSD